MFITLLGGAVVAWPLAVCASSRRKDDARISAQWRLSYLSAADLGASNSVEHASTRAELGYDSPGSVTNSFGNSSRRFHESTFESATFFASASGSAPNLSAHTGGSAAITASSDGCFAILSAVLPSDQPPQLKPTTIVATAPAAAPCSRRLSDSP